MSLAGLSGRDESIGRAVDYETFQTPPLMSNATIRTQDDVGRRRRRGDDDAGRDLRLRHCSRAAAELKSNTH